MFSSSGSISFCKILGPGVYLRYYLEPSVLILQWESLKRDESQNDTEFIKHVCLKVIRGFWHLLLLAVCCSSQTSFFVKSFLARLSVSYGTHHEKSKGTTITKKECKRVSGSVFCRLPKTSINAPVISLNRLTGCGLRTELRLVCDVLVNSFLLGLRNICVFWVLSSWQHKGTWFQYLSAQWTDFWGACNCL